MQHVTGRNLKAEQLGALAQRIRDLEQAIRIAGETAGNRLVVDNPSIKEGGCLPRDCVALVLVGVALTGIEAG